MFLRELAEVRNNGNQMWDRENRLLGDAKAEATKHAERLMQDLVEIRSAHEALVLRHAKVNAEQVRE